MEIPQHPNRMLFVNIPVADLDRSVEFFTQLGFTFNPMFTDETATCMLVGEQAHFMLLTREKFASFAKQPMADTTTHTPAMYCFSVDARADVDAVTDRALAAGGTELSTMDHGFMYSRSFGDLDGHHWEVLWMDPAAAAGGPEAELAAPATS